MDIAGIMEKKNFFPSESGRECQWHIKKLFSKERKVFVAVTDYSGSALPDSLKTPVWVGIYDFGTG